MTQARRRIPNAAQSAAAQVHLRRAYADGRHGQLHVTTAYPSGGGFDERTPLVCLHPAASSGSWFRALLPELGRERSVYAPDLPAHGQSDPQSDGAAGGMPVIGDYIAAMGDFLDSMRLRNVDVLGHGLGALVAAGLAAQRPEQIRRVVLVPADEASRNAAPRNAKGEMLPVAALTQPALVLYPATGNAAAKRPDPSKPQHTAMSVPQSAVELYGEAAPELARLLRDFLDR